MFDIGPSELLVIFVVALLVIGPERLPSAVKTTSLWIGRFRRSFHKIKADVERELNADEIRRQLHNESILAEVEDAKNQAKEIASNVERAAVEELGIESQQQTPREGDQQDTAGEEAATESQNEDTSNQADATGDNTEQNNSPGTPAQTSDSTKPAATNNDEPTVAGELKQAVSYVNDISREVQATKEDIAEKIKNPGFANKKKSGETE